jgi:hypothetical protein
VKILFLDDSFTGASWFSGYGGFACDAQKVRPIADAITTVKDQFGIPHNIEIKWSPPPDHFLRTDFAGSRHELYESVIAAVGQHGGVVLCAVFELKECYGVKLHGWDRRQAQLWAAKKQLRYLAERFERPICTSSGRHGLIVCDQYSSRDDEDVIAAQAHYDMFFGTDYQKMDTLAHVPLIGSSSYSPLLQAADVIIGAVTSAMSRGQYGVALFPAIARLLLQDPIIGIARPSAGALGYGLKVMPDTAEGRVRKLFGELDQMYEVVASKWIARSRK